MVKWLLAIAVVILAVVFVSFGWGGGKGPALNVVGSTSVQPFAEMLAQAFEESHPGQYVDVQGGGSTAGLQAAANGIADIGMCSRALKPDETQFEAVVIARDGLAVIVHPSNPIANLTREQIRRLFSGEVANWRDYCQPRAAGPLGGTAALGGADCGEGRTVRPITREEGSGTREAFVKMIMGGERISRKALTQESNGAVKELVRSDPCAIGYMSLGLVGTEVKAVSVDGVPPTSENAAAGRYPLIRPFLFVTRGRPSPRAQAFIDFVLSPEGQQMLQKEGLVGAK